MPLERKEICSIFVTAVVSAAHTAARQSSTASSDEEDYRYGPTSPNPASNVEETTSENQGKIALKALKYLDDRSKDLQRDRKSVV